MKADVRILIAFVLVLALSVYNVYTPSPHRQAGGEGYFSSDLIQVRGGARGMASAAHGRFLGAGISGRLAVSGGTTLVVSGTTTGLAASSTTVLLASPGVSGQPFTFTVPNVLPAPITSTPSVTVVTPGPVFTPDISANALPAGTPGQFPSVASSTLLAPTGTPNQALPAGTPGQFPAATTTVTPTQTVTTATTVQTQALVTSSRAALVPFPLNVSTVAVGGEGMEHGTGF